MRRSDEAGKAGGVIARINRRQLLKGAAKTGLVAGFGSTVLGYTSKGTWAQTDSSGISADVVKIGVLDDMTGLYADQTGEGGVLAVKMAVEDFGGKVLGKPIEVVQGDHQNNADIGAGIAREWYDRDNVDAIIGLGNSSVALAVQEITRRKNRVDIVSGAGSVQITGESCSPNGIHWTYNTYAVSKSTADAILKQGGKSWYFVTADYAFGHSLEKNAREAVEAGGGKVLGSVRHPINTRDFSSFLLTAQASGADVIGFANAGGDTIGCVRQASEFGIVAGGQRLAALLVQIVDIDTLGLEAAQGLEFTSAFYWDHNKETREWSERFMKRHDKAPGMSQAGMYGAASHYLKAIDAAGTDKAEAVIAKMREMPVNDFMTQNGKLREDGRVVRDMYLERVKKPSESSGRWDYLNVVATIPKDVAYRPLSESNCPLIK